MKPFILTLTTVLLYTLSYAQPFSAGPMVGLNYSRLDIDEHFQIANEEYAFEYKSPGIGPSVGAYGNLAFGRFYVQSQLRLSCERSVMSLQNWESSQLQTFSSTRIQMPLLLGYQMNNMRLFAGPMMNRLLDASLVPTNEDRFALYQGATNKTSLGYQMGVGFQLKKAIFSFQLMGNLTNQGIALNYQNNLIKTSKEDHVMLFSFSYQIFETKPRKKQEDFILPQDVVVSEE